MASIKIGTSEEAEELGNCIKENKTIYLWNSLNYNSQEEKLISLDEEEEESSQLNKLEKSNFVNNSKAPFKSSRNLIIDNPIKFCYLCLDNISTITIN